MWKARTYQQSVSTPTPIALGREPTGVAPPDAAVKTMLAARRGLQGLVDRAAPIDLVVWMMCLGTATTKILGAMARLRVADLLASDGPMTGATIAEKTMHRALRAAATLGVFTLDGEGRFSNNFRSEALRSGRPGALREFVEYFGTRSNVSVVEGIAR